MSISLLVRITQLCRAYLWGGDAVLSKIPPISWDWVCKPKKAGGLGVRSCELGNKAALGKYIWKIAEKKDSLWVWWVHAVYIKNTDWWQYAAKRGDGWAWKKLCALKNELMPGFHYNNWSQQGYKFTECYKWLQGHMDKVPWTAWVWNRFNIPKHCIILWLAMHKRLRTRDVLTRIGVSNDSVCLLCGDRNEDMDHMFFQCQYSRKCMMILCDWLNIKELRFDIDRSWKHWKRQLPSSIPMKAGLATLAALVYYIWLARN